MLMVLSSIFQEIEDERAVRLRSARRRIKKTEKKMERNEESDQSKSIGASSARWGLSICDVSESKSRIDSETDYVIVITFYSPSGLGQGQQRDLSVFESSCHLFTCLPHMVEASHCPFNC